MPTLMRLNETKKPAARCGKICLAMVVVLAACDAAAQQVPSQPAAVTVQVTQMPSRPEEPPAPPLSADEKQLVEDCNGFAVDLYTQLDKREGNVFFSPASISTALAMTYAGARGETAAEMARILHFHLDPEKLHRAMGSLLHRIAAPTSNYELRESNSLWLQKDLAFRPEFLEMAQGNYDGAVEQVDFKSNVENVRAAINAKVENQTHGRIKDLLPPGLLTTDTRLALTNSIYFKGDWDVPFPLDQTTSKAFFITPNKTVSVPMMYQRDHFNYLDGGSFQALEIPYKTGKLSMTIFLPAEKLGLTEFERTLSPNSLAAWLGELKDGSRPIDLTVPKFKTNQEFELVDTLLAMGLKLPFSQYADFSGMTSAARLCLSAIGHKAVIAVDEKGAEATAGMTSTMRLTSAIVPPPVPITFRADHPFVFLIRDKRSGSILFLGRLTNPS